MLSLILCLLVTNTNYFNFTTLQFSKDPRISEKEEMDVCYIINSVYVSILVSQLPQTAKKKKIKKSTAVSKKWGSTMLFVYSFPPAGVGCSERCWWKEATGKQIINTVKSKPLFTCKPFLLTWFKLFYSKQSLWLCSFRVSFLTTRGKKNKINVSLQLFCVLIQNLGNPTCKTNPNPQTMEFIRVDEQQWVKLTA